MKYNFPIKYGIMPIYEIDEKTSETVLTAYIPSLCYIISETTNYTKDGRQKMEYEVVFPYQESESANNVWHRTHPQFMGDKCTNSCHINSIHDSLNKAQEKADELNSNILRQKLSFFISDDKQIELVKKEHYDNLRRLNDLVCKIEINCKELRVNSTPTEQNIIVSYGTDNECLPISIYEFLTLYKGLNFRAFSISKEEFTALQENLDNNERIDIDCKNYLLDNSNGITKLASLDERIIQGSLYLDENNNLLHCYDNLNNCNEQIPYKGTKNPYKGIKIFTTESYEDIVSSYKQSENIKNLYDNEPFTR